MSTVITDQLLGRAVNDYIIGVTKNQILKVPGQVIQTVYTKSTTRTTYSANNDNVSRPISSLDTTITPKFSNSEIWIEWYIFYEMHYDTTFQALRNGSVVGYNTDAGNVRYSGIGSGDYEYGWDLNSTPSYKNMTYVDLPNTTSATTYGLGVRSSTTGNYTMYLNRTAGSSGTDSYETGVSWCIIREIAR